MGYTFADFFELAIGLPFTEWFGDTPEEAFGEKVGKAWCHRLVDDRTELASIVGCSDLDDEHFAENVSALSPEQALAVYQVLDRAWYRREREHESLHALDQDPGEQTRPNAGPEEGFGDWADVAMVATLVEFEEDIKDHRQLLVDWGIDPDSADLRAKVSAQREQSEQPPDDRSARRWSPQIGQLVVNALFCMSRSERKI